MAGQGTDISSIDRVILEELHKGGALQEMIDRLHDETGIQIAFFSMDYELLNSAIGEESTRIFEFIKEKRRMPVTMLRQYITDEQFELFRSGRTVSVDLNDHNKNCIICRPLIGINGNGCIMGLMYKATDNPELATYVADQLARIYTFLSHQVLSTDLKSDFFEKYIAKELLLQDGDLRQSLYWEIGWRQQGRRQNQLLTPNYIVAEYTSIDYSNNDSELEAIRAKMRRFIPDTISVIYKHRIVSLICGLSGDLRPDEKVIERIVEYSRVNHLYCGVSGVFGDLADRRGYKRQAHAVRVCGQFSDSDGTLFTPESQYYDMLAYGAGKQFGVNALRLSCIERLADYDRENNTDYVRTLTQYIEHENKLTDSAKAMFLDRNTMKYRLQKIQRIIGLDLEDYDTMRQIRRALCLRRLSDVL